MRINLSGSTVDSHNSSVSISHIMPSNPHRQAIITVLYPMDFFIARLLCMQRYYKTGHSIFGSQYEKNDQQVAECPNYLFWYMLFTQATVLHSGQVLGTWRCGSFCPWLTSSKNLLSVEDMRKTSEVEIQMEIIRSLLK